MSDALLTLIDQQAPHEFSLQQIEALQAGARKSPEVKAALADRLRFEDGLNATLGEPLLSVEQIVQAVTAAAAVAAVSTVVDTASEAVAESATAGGSSAAATSGVAASATGAAGTTVAASPVIGWALAVAIAALSLFLPVVGVMVMRQGQQPAEPPAIEVPLAPPVPQVGSHGIADDPSIPLAPPPDLPPAEPLDEDASPSDLVPPGFDY